MTIKTTIAAGTKLGPYEVLSLLGAGGMGEVYRAKDTRLGRDVAVKVLPRSFASDPDRLRRFEQEARATGMLNHPNILAVHDIGTHDGAPYVVSELLEGQTLRQRIDGAPMPARKATELAAQFARGLAAAHDKGIVHRDLKPDNLFVTREGRIKILDFGLAKVAPPALATAETAMLAETAPVAMGSPGTEAGMILGTASYMSPEQIRAAPADNRSDIFSFGLVFYEMLTGRPAFRADSAVETMSAILKADPPRMAAHAEDLPPELERIVLHCLEKNPEERFQSTHDIAFQLESMSGISPARALAAPSPSQWQRHLKPALVGVALLASGALIGFAARKDAPVLKPEFEPLTFRRGSVPAARFAPDGSTVVYSAGWEGTPVSLYTAQAGTPESRSLNVAGTIRSVSKSGELILTIPRPGRPAMLARLPLGSGAPRELVERVRDADWAPNGEDVAVVSTGGGRHTLQFPIGKAIYEPAGWISSLRVSPTGDRIAFAEHPILQDLRGGVSVVDLEGHKTTIADGFEDVGRVGWSPDGREIWFSASTAGVDHVVYAAPAGGGPTRVLLAGPGHFGLQDVSASGDVLVSHGVRRPSIVVRAPGAAETELGWMDYSILKDMSSDGRRILFSEQGVAGGAGYSVYVRSTDGSAAVRLGKGDAQSLSFDGQWALAVDLATHTLNLLPTGAGQPRIANHDITAYSWAGFLPGDKSIVFVGEKGGVTRIYVQDLDGRAPRPITPDGVTISRNTVSPDGKWLAAIDQGKIMQYPIAGGEPRAVAGTATLDNPIRWNANGTVLYVGVTTGSATQVFALDPATGTRKALLDIAPRDRVGAGGIQVLFLSADGTSYAFNYIRTLQNLYVIKNVR
ncbi:MAG: serine/threonine-protein kinase [Acidobacteriota bacterium]|nr:serine/threonine-protein kinase [Acidobacteriota bacterium]MDQ3417838.1 serine/threonine-protein kinase [Acidobacteriota bacterium]